MTQVHCPNSIGCATLLPLVAHLFSAAVIVQVVLFCLASFQALIAAFAAGIAAAVPWSRGRSVSLGILGQLAANNLLATVPAACWIAAWLALDPNTWGWVFQDGMGIALMVLVLRQFLLPNLKVTFSAVGCITSM